MKTQLTATVAATITLLLNSAPSSAAEPQFQTPATERAQESAQFLTQSARAFSGTQVSNLWLYPTAERNTVFAHYTLNSNEHLALVTVDNDHIAKVRDLTDASGGPHWTAAIGTGHVSESTANTNSGVTHGAPASPHWTAAIGTGSASQNSVREVTSPVPPNQAVAGAHWASRIGTGQASESTVRAAKRPSAVVADTSSATSP